MSGIRTDVWDESRTVEQEIARIASQQHGIVTRAQLLAAGIPRMTIARRVRVGLLLVQHRGVFRAGHCAPSHHARYMAAVLACGPGSLLAGRAAGHLIALLKAAPSVPDVIALGERKIHGVTVRRARRSEGVDAWSYQGIPVTTVPRTLVDLASDLTTEQLTLAVHEAAVRHKTKPDDVEAVLERRPTAKGARILRAILRGDERVTLSELERRFLDLLRAAAMPLPTTNIVLGGFRVDCHWDVPRLTVELDGYRYHHTRHAWEQDRRRERLARARGDEFRRYTYGDVFEHPRLMMRELRALLGGEVFGISTDIRSEPRTARRR